MSIATADLVQALHRAVFGVSAEPENLDAHIAEIGDDPAALIAFADRLHAFAKHIDRGARHSLADHSQDGEYRILLRELIRSGSRHQMIVDVGANGREGSNSYDLLSEFGWKGLLIEANPALVPRIRLGFGSADYHLVEAAVGVETGRMPFYVGASDALSSLIEANAALFAPVSGTVDVDVRRLGEILDANAIPEDFDILSLDIEGMDVPVLNDLIATTAYRPALIVIEGSYCGLTKALSEIGVSDEAASLYDIVGVTAPNLILRKR